MRQGPLKSVPNCVLCLCVTARMGGGEASRARFGWLLLDTAQTDSLLVSYGGLQSGPNRPGNPHANCSDVPIPFIAGDGRGRTCA